MRLAHIPDNITSTLRDLEQEVSALLDGGDVDRGYIIQNIVEPMGELLGLIERLSRFATIDLSNSECIFHPEKYRGKVKDGNPVVFYYLSWQDIHDSYEVNMTDVRNYDVKLFEAIKNIFYNNPRQSLQDACQEIEALEISNKKNIIKTLNQAKSLSDIIPRKIKIKSSS